jgi:hypothetical protein
MSAIRRPLRATGDGRRPAGAEPDRLRRRALRRWRRGCARSSRRCRSYARCRPAWTLRC